MDYKKVAAALIAKADSTTFPEEAIAFREKATHFLSLVAPAAEVAACPDSADGSHRYCWDGCCGGYCRDCNEMDPDFDGEY